MIIVASVTALTGTTPNVSYSTGKAGLVNLARHIAVHYGDQGIRANSICPGALERTPDHDDHPDPVGREATAINRVPLNRLGIPEDIAPFITFLATGRRLIRNRGELRQRRWADRYLVRDLNSAHEYPSSDS